MGFKRARYGVAILLALTLGGCAAIPGFGPPPVDVYDLRPPAPPAKGRRLSRTQILVPEPTALALLDGESVAIRRADGALQLLGGVRWSDRLPRLVQAGLVEAYQRTGRIGGVGRPGEGLAIDYQVIADIRVFEVKVGDPPADRAQVELFVRVLDDRNGVVRASRDFTASAAVVGSGDQAFIAALDRAFSTVTAEIVEWSIGVM